MIDKVVKGKCTGCNMCADICSQKAIYYITDNEGFSVPKVDYEKCIKCGLCVKKCPGIMENIFKKDIPKVFAAWANNDEIRIQSTSGGMYYLIAQKFIENNGYIVGSVYDKDFKGAHHVIGNTVEDLKKIMGSKYFQSNAEGIYGKVKELLEKNAKVLFCGTPCQSAALQAFLGKEYENLYIIDFICRGVNSPLAYRKRIEELEEEHNSKVKLVHLKNKKTGWQSIASYVEFENGDTYHKDKNTSPWVKGFIGCKGLFMRNSCYDCRYRELPRISDITIGDFWGIHGMKPEDMFKGISCVMVNSTKGRKMFEDIKENITFEERNLDELLAGNPAATDKLENHNNRNKFFEMLKTEKFSKAVEENIEEYKESLAKKVFRKIRSVAKKINFVLHLDVIKFIKYNYFSKNVVREKGVYLIPHRGTVLELSKNSRIYIKNKNLELCACKLKKSKAEMYLKMNGNAKWYSNNGAQINYNSYIEIHNNAVLNTKFFTANCGAVIVCARKINIGEDVMMSRNATIYDSDFHQVFDENMKGTNYPKEITIGNHVWITTNVTILKGASIGRDSIVSAKTVVRKEFPENSIISGEASGKVVADCIGWSRKAIESEKIQK